MPFRLFCHDAAHFVRFMWPFTGKELSVCAVLDNPYKPSVPFLGPRQTVQTQIRPGSSVFARNRVKMKKNIPDTLKIRNGHVQLIRTGGSTRQMWINVVLGVYISFQFGGHGQDVTIQLSHVMRKPVFAICEQQRRRSACASAQSDQHLCCSLPR